MTQKLSSVRNIVDLLDALHGQVMKGLRRAVEYW